MKQFKTILFATALFLGATTLSTAQSKVAHIDSQALIGAMPETKAAQAEIEKLEKTYQVAIEEMIAEYQNKLKRYDAEAASQTDDENAKRMTEVETMQRSIREYQGQAQEDLQKKQFDLLKPITEKVKAAIVKVAKAQGFDYVLESTPNNGIVIMADGKDLIADVKKELGI
ncbi:OmpH family outer membrane protein [Paucihalobacter sp.]|uniref:OmpH family outer membrane protein n=1 Tax=Paucihalobacter sp. TaxID=2850405 RepID=UPI002FE10944